MKILISGAGGQLGTDVAATAEREGRHQVVTATKEMLDVGDRDQVLAGITQLVPDLIIHCAAWTDVDGCEADPDRAWRDNALACRHVAEAASLTRAHVVAVSTDYVFDGTKPDPYVEWDPPNPLSVYGRSKLGGEEEIRRLLPAATIVRTSWLCGRHGQNMVKTVLRLDGPLRFVDDQRGCPTFTDDLAPALLRLGVSRRPGLFHVTNQGPATWFELAREIIKAAGGDPSRVEPISTLEMDPPRAARRPANSVLDNAALRLSNLPLLPDYHEALERSVKALTA